MGSFAPALAPETCGQGAALARLIPCQAGQRPHHIPHDHTNPDT